MKAVVDTAYYQLDNPESAAEVLRFWQDIRDALAPSIWEAEIPHVVWMSIHAGVLPEAEGQVKLHLARRLGVHTIPSRALWHGALLRSVRSGIAVYDTLFVELAERERVPLVTFDQRLLKRWSGIARRPADASAAVATAYSASDDRCPGNAHGCRFSGTARHSRRSAAAGASDVGASNQISTS